MSLPAYNLVGGAEKDSSAGGGDISEPNWRLYPFQRYTSVADRFLSVIPGQDHDQMGNGGSAEAKSFIAANTRAFFDTYIRGQASCACAVGTLAPLAGVDQRTKPAAAPASRVESCR